MDNSNNNLKRLSVVIGVEFAFRNVSLILCSELEYQSNVLISVKQNPVEKKAKRAMRLSAVLNTKSVKNDPAVSVRD